MNSGRDRKLTLSDPGRDAAGDELDRILADAETAEKGEDVAGDDAGADSFLERFPAPPRRERRAS